MASEHIIRRGAAKTRDSPATRKGRGRTAGSGGDVSPATFVKKGPPKGKRISGGKQHDALCEGGGRFVGGLLKGRYMNKEVRVLPGLSYYGKVILGRGPMISRYKPGTPVSPEAEGRGFRNLQLMSRPPHSTLVDTSEGFDSRHHVFQIGRGGTGIAMKIYRPEDRAFGPGFAGREFENLILARKGLLLPYVRPLRDDLSAAYDKKKGLWLPTYKWARLFTEMPEGYMSINRLDFKNMPKDQRQRLVEEIAFAMGYMHRRRGSHGDSTLANTLIRHPAWMLNRFSPDNIKYIDAESFSYVGQLPTREEIGRTFADDVRTAREDALRLGLVRPDEDNHMFRKRFWNSYMSHWRAGARPSRLEPEVERMGPNVFFASLPKKADYAPIVPTDEMVRDVIRSGLSVPAAVADSPAPQRGLPIAWRVALLENAKKRRNAGETDNGGLPPEP